MSPKSLLKCTKKLVHRWKLPLFLTFMYSAILNVVVLWGARLAHAQGSISGSIPNPIKADTLKEFLLDVVEILIAVGIPVAVVFIIYSGLLFVTARGNEEQLRRAKHTLFWAVIGTAILLGAWVIIEVIVGTIDVIEN